MGIKPRMVLALCLLASLVARADFPENNLYLQDEQMKKSTSMTQARFDEIINDIVDKMKGYVALQGGNLVVDHNWEDSTVNAYASQNGKTWRVAMFGGLARRPEVTDDGFAMVVCHELGHHMGGFPFYSSGIWAATEGQSDFYATHACARAIWGKELGMNARFRRVVDPTAKQTCDENFTSNADKDLCYRTAMAGKSLADLLAAITGSTKMPEFTTPDVTVVTKTYEGHPKAQCRLDTYFAGALCDVDFNLKHIPGKFGNAEAQKSIEAEKEMAAVSCIKSNAKMGQRPQCWFKPRL